MIDGGRFGFSFEDQAEFAEVLLEATEQAVCGPIDDGSVSREGDDVGSGEVVQQARTPELFYGRARPVMKGTTRGSLKGSVVSISENKSVVARFGEMVDGGDLSQLDFLCAPDVTNHALAAGRASGIEGTREFLASSGRQAHAGRWVERVVVAEDDYVVEYGSRAGNWPAGNFRGFYIPAGHYERDVAFMYRLRDRRIAERWAVRDDLALMLQLGAVIPTPNSA